MSRWDFLASKPSSLKEAYDELIPELQL